MAQPDGWEDPPGKEGDVESFEDFEEALKVSVRDTLDLQILELVHEAEVYGPDLSFKIIALEFTRVRRKSLEQNLEYTLTNIWFANSYY